MFDDALFINANYEVDGSFQGAELWKVESDNVLGTTAFSAETISLFPNPASSEIHITNLKTDSTFEVYSILGKAVMNGTLSSSENTIDIAELAAGIYLIRIEEDQKLSTIRFVKQ